MGLLSKVVGSVAKVATGGLGGIAKKAIGGLLNKTGLGGMIGKLFGGKIGGNSDGMAVLKEIKNMLSQLVQQMDDKNGGQCSKGGGRDAGGCGDSPPSCRPDRPGQGHAQECEVNIPGFSPIICGDMSGHRH